MMRSFFIPMVFVLIPAVLPHLSFSGEKTGNGGGGWICRNEAGQIQWSMLIDLYEAQTQWHLTLQEMSGNTQSIVDDAVQTMTANDAHLNGISSYVQQLQYLDPSNSNVVYTNNTLPVVDDALYSLIPPVSQCAGRLSYEQIVNYQDFTGKILVQKELFNFLNIRDKAALVVHEGVYAFRRAGYDLDSMNTRHLVGLAFSTISPQDFHDQIERLYNYSPALLTSGDYLITFRKLNRDGSFATDQPYISISTRGIDSASGSFPLSFGANADASGNATITIPQANISDFQVSPTLIVAIDAVGLGQSAISSLGWAQELAFTETDGRPSLYCDETLVRVPDSNGPGSIAVICADAPATD